MAQPQVQQKVQPKRRRRWLRRLVLLFVILLVLGVGGFTWIAYWPLEGSVERVDVLVPASVDYVLKGTWRDIRDGDWLQQNVLEEPFLPQIREAVDGMEKGLAQIREMEGRINASIPLGITTFSLQEDVLGAEAVVAGRICRGWGPERGMPWTREWVVLLRVSWKVKLAVAAMKHGFIRDMVSRQAGETVEVENGVYRMVLRGVRTTAVRNREGCEPGYVIPPENEIYVTRVRDVLAVGNSKELVNAVAEQGRTDDTTSTFTARPGVRLDVPHGGVAAAVDMPSLHQYLIRALEMYQRPFGILQRFVTVSSLERMNATLSFPSTDLAVGTAEIPYSSNRLARGVGDVYDLAPESLRTGMPAFLPADDTYAVLLVSSPPIHLLRAFYEDAISEGDRALIRQNLQNNKSKYADVDHLLVDLAQHLGHRAAFALGRLSTALDKADYAEWYTTDIKANPKPLPGFALMVTLREGVNADEVDAFLAEQVPALGFKKDIVRKEYKGIHYSLLELEKRSADMALASPAYMLVQGSLILANNEDWFRKIIDTIGGGPSLAAEPTFQATIAALPESAQVGLFVDLDKLFRVPPTSDPGGQPRGVLWDDRNIWVVKNRDAEEAAGAYRMQTRGGRNLSEAEEEELDTKVDEFKANYIAKYPQFLEERRKELAGFGRLRSFGLAFVATRTTLEGHVVLVLKPPVAP